MKKVQLVDVTLRDGLQLVSRVLSLEEKVALWHAVRGVGAERIEVTSFVSPKWMPQFADAAELSQRIAAESPPELLARCMAFVPNDRGLDRFLTTPFGWAAGFLSVSETFHEKNVNATRAATLAALPEWVKRCHGAGRKFRLYLSTAFGCPFEGAVADSEVVRLTVAGIRAGADEVAVSDTLGVALPDAVSSLTRKLIAEIPVERLAFHLHNTYGFAAASALAAANLGVTQFDGALSGLGGCPYAKGATGNVALEDLAYAFARSGARTVVDWTTYEKGVATLAKQGHPVRSRLGELWSRGGTVRML